MTLLEESLKTTTATYLFRSKRRTKFEQDSERSLVIISSKCPFLHHNYSWYNSKQRKQQSKSICTELDIANINRKEASPNQKMGLPLNNLFL